MIKKVLLGLVLCVTTLSSTGVTVLAQANKIDEAFYSENDIVNYNPAGDFCGNVTSGVYGDTYEEKLWTGFLAQGLTPIQAAGAFGNITNEGGGSPTRHETSFASYRKTGVADSIMNAGNGNGPYQNLTTNKFEDFDTNVKYSYGIGLIQWSFGRRVGVIDKLKEAGLYDPFIKDYETYNLDGPHIVELAKSGTTQLDDNTLNRLYEVELNYLMGELTGGSGYYKTFLETEWDTPEKSADAFYSYMERGLGSVTTAPDARRNDAKRIWDMYQSGAFKSVSSSGGGSGSSSGSSTGDGTAWISVPGITKGEPTGKSGAGGSNSFASGQPTKIVLHDTEGGAGWPDYTGGSIAPHFTVDLKTKTGRQHFPLNTTSGATGNGDAESIQIEIKGFVTKNSVSGGSSEYVLSNMADEDWDYLAKYLVAINKATGIPLTSTLNWDNAGPEDSSQRTSVRLSQSEWDSFKGVAGHMHVPGDDHWDPGPIWAKVQQAVGRVSGQDQCGGGASGLEGTVLKYAWHKLCGTNDSGCAADEGEVPATRGHSSVQKDTYKAKHSTIDYFKGGCSGNDCGGWVTFLIRESGWDPEYNSSCNNGSGAATPCQISYLRGSDKWYCVYGCASSDKTGPETVKTEADLKPGDVYFSDSSGAPGHTWAYVGEIQGFGSKIASASYSTPCSTTRAPTAGGEGLLEGIIFRMKR
ncbi:MAG: phage tail-type lysozyme domain-containing protein [Candidatus Nomurabacteria bacterium]|nr:phage tail-type lysozyme domain-containing protein [Candidatus Nomurabacteria bacterium]